MLLVDQFEEVFTLCRDDVRREAAIDNLIYAATVVGGQTVVVLTLRADFYGHAARYSELAAALSEHQVLIPRMTPSELKRAIEQPALAAGAKLETGLADRLVDDVGSQLGGLPLLQHALLELSSRRTVTGQLNPPKSA